jgi:hypothetical protein
MINPMDTTSAWPLFRMVSTVLPTRCGHVGVEDGVQEHGDLCVDVGHGAGAEPVRDVADHAEQGE